MELKKKISLEQKFKSKLPLNKLFNCVEFILCNPKAIPCTFNLFDGWSITPVPNTPYGYVPVINPLYTTPDRFPVNPPPFPQDIPPLVCYIVGSQEYNMWITGYDVVCVRQIQLTVQTNKLEQLGVPFEILTKDANGNECIIPRLPLTDISTDQFQPTISVIDFSCNDLILDNQTIFSQYVVLPYSKVKMVIYFDDVDRIDVLKINKPLCKITDVTTCGQDANSRREKEIEWYSERPTVRPNWMKPFKFSMIKGIEIDSACCPEP